MTASLSSPARRVESQSTADIVNWVRTQFGLTHEQIGILVGVTARSAQRWSDAGNPTVPVGPHRAKIEQLRDLRRLLEHSFPSNIDAALQWLHAPVPLLEGRRPIDLIKQGRMDRVISVLAGAYAGAFA
ncbi:MAG: antitoxin Xre/MbcA/ParS toxin-binding domain-containing protein [Gemmatimonadaceae bacterium]